MTRHGTRHWDVAAYALGVLDPAEVAECESHLAECETCAAELDALLPASRLLADVDLETLREAEESQFGDRLLDAIRQERGRVHRRRRVLAAAGTAVAAAVAGVALLAGATWLASPPERLPSGITAAGSPSPDEPPGIGGPDLVNGEQISVADPATGVEADVILVTTDWGTQISFALSSVTGPRECHLLVVREDGTTESLGSWRVPEEGYGTAEHPDPLLLQVPTGTARADLAQLQVRETGPDGAVTTLVTVGL